MRTNAIDFNPHGGYRFSEDAKRGIDIRRYVVELVHPGLDPYKLTGTVVIAPWSDLIPELVVRAGGWSDAAEMFVSLTTFYSVKLAGTIGSFYGTDKECLRLLLTGSFEFESKNQMTRFTMVTFPGGALTQREIYNQANLEAELRGRSSWQKLCDIFSAQRQNKKVWRCVGLLMAALAGAVVLSYTWQIIFATVLFLFVCWATFKLLFAAPKGAYYE